MVEKIVSGAIEEVISGNRRASGLAGAKARAAALTTAKRNGIAAVAAKARWSNVMDTSQTQTPPADECVVLMYPDNQLGEPVREYENSLNVGDVLKETFFSDQ